MKSMLWTSSGRRRALIASVLAGACVALPVLADSYVSYFRAVPIDNVSHVRALLAAGFDPNTIEPKRGETGLMIAAREDAMDVFRALLKAPGSDINHRAFNGDTALMIASLKGNREAVEALIERGATVHHPGWTPLHYAASDGHDEIVSILLNHGAEVDARSPNQTTPMMMAAWHGHIYTVKLLLDAGADATLKNERGMTAIDFARIGDHQDIVEGLTWRLKKMGKL